MEKLLYKLNDFEGPLDVLLHLIKKNKFNIYDIQISELLKQYMEHIEKMKKHNMDISSEFLEMAAKLVYIKTVFLLPKHEEAEALKQELTEQIIEYKQLKDFSMLLKNKMNFDFFCRSPEKINFDMTYSLSHDIVEIFNVYVGLEKKENLDAFSIKKSFSKIVSKKIVSVLSKVFCILRKLKKINITDYESLFLESKSKSDLVATFLAVLELVKVKRITIDEKNKKIKLLDGDIKFGSEKS